MVTEVFRDMLDEGVIVYIDDILIYSETEEQHEELVKKVLQRLKDTGLCASIKKTHFHVPEVEYLGYIISKDDISMAQDKVDKILAWPRPGENKPGEKPKTSKRLVEEVRSFIGFCNFY
jgi:hypothetical protein